MSKKHLGLVVGSFLAIIHAVWSLAVALIPTQLQSFIDWVFVLHHIDMSFTIVTPFVLSNAVVLVVFTFVVGYILGWLLAVLHRGCGKCH